ncbi:hypothetical protein JCM10908_006085 [Rhodotorula pacifica]|uniref:enoyl-CoA hydratase/isomerase family protein n=1 Tax=Rhodotorula pacifica TaxID=1495444 RepID=UPI003172C927
MSNADAILVEIKAPYAIITLNQPKKKNALDFELYKRLTQTFLTIDKNPDVFVTVLTGTGDFMSAGADVKATREEGDGDDVRARVVARFREGNMALTRAVYRHSKLLVAAMNGPVIGLSAALLGYFDFIYAVESAYFLTPFSAISLVCEGGSSQSLVQRMGLAKANEALLLGRKLSARELLANGFVNEVFPNQSSPDFVKQVLSHLDQKLDGLELDAILTSKSLIRASLIDPEATNEREILAGGDRFATGKPQARFAKLAAKQMRHKI